MSKGVKALKTLKSLKAPNGFPPLEPPSYRLQVTGSQVTGYRLLQLTGYRLQVSCCYSCYRLWFQLQRISHAGEGSADCVTICRSKRISEQFPVANLDAKLSANYERITDHVSDGAVYIPAMDVILQVSMSTLFTNVG